MNNLINFLTAGILAAAPLLFGVLGELLTEKSGNLNLGVEGMMFMGGIAGIVGPYYYEKAGFRFCASAFRDCAGLSAGVCGFVP